MATEVACAECLNLNLSTITIGIERAEINKSLFSQRSDFYSLFWKNSITIAESFYNVKNGSSIITSKSSSKNLSNENKHWFFGCLQDKLWIKMSILWKYRVFLFSLLTFFDEHSNWWYVFDVVKRLRYSVLKV